MKPRSVRFLLGWCLLACVSRGIESFSTIGGVTSSRHYGIPRRRRKLRTVELPLVNKESGMDDLRYETIEVSGGAEETESDMADEMVEYHVPQDDTTRHLGLVVAFTAPWYLYCSLQMAVFNPPETFFGIPEPVVTAMGLYVFVSQVGVYLGMDRLSKASSLQEAQRIVGVASALCIPADAIATLYDPVGNQGLTVLAFAWATTWFGVFLAHYLRKAAFREIPPQETHHHGSALEGESPSIWKTLQDYRPPAEPQSAQLALEFTRGFVSFIISVEALGRFFAEGHEFNFWIVASLISVNLHTSVECFLATTYPGVELEENNSFLAAESFLYAIHMVASSIVTHEEGFGDALVDQILFAWLFGNATGKLIDRLGKLLGKIDFDAKIGLSKLI